MVKKIKKVYYWIYDNPFDPSPPIDSPNWYVDSVTCSECGFPFHTISCHVVGHDVKYCPGCGGYIDGVKNPKPSIY